MKRIPALVKIWFPAPTASKVCPMLFLQYTPASYSLYCYNGRLYPGVKSSGLSVTSCPECFFRQVSVVDRRHKDRVEAIFPDAAGVVQQLFNGNLSAISIEGEVLAQCIAELQFALFHQLQDAGSRE